MLHSALAVSLLAASPTVAPPPVFSCRGNGAEWSLRIDGDSAALATVDARGLNQNVFEGRVHESGEGARTFAYRGRARGSQADLVAMVTRESCAEAPSGDRAAARRDYTVRLSLPDGTLLAGCCEIESATAHAAIPAHVEEKAVLAPAPASAAAGAAAPAPATVGAPAAPTATSEGAAPAVAGRVTGLTLSDGRQCRSTSPGATVVVHGQRVNFECGRWEGDELAIVGPLTAGDSGLLIAQKGVVEWRESGNRQRELEPTAARASEITLADGLICRLAGSGATLAFAGRRANYTCGLKDGDTVALLGELEPAEGGFRIVRARVTHGEGGFTLRSSEPILVTAPR